MMPITAIQRDDMRFDDLRGNQARGLLERTGLHQDMNGQPR